MKEIILNFLILSACAFAIFLVTTLGWFLLGGLFWWFNFLNKLFPFFLNN